MGLEILTIDGHDAEFLLLEYANDDKLYVPVGSYTSSAAIPAEMKIRRPSTDLAPSSGAKPVKKRPSAHPMLPLSC